MERKNTKKLITIIIAIILAIILILIVFKIFGEVQDEYYVENSPQRQSYRTITYNDEKYVRKDNITTFLLIGTDFSETESSIYRQADFLAVLLFDSSSNSYNIIQINRDTMTTVSIYSDMFGTYLRDREMQITLSYAYGGSSEAKRAEHTMMAVERLLNLHINDYACLDMDGIKSVIEYVDGITLTIPDDMTAINASLQKDTEITFDRNNSSLALQYLRARTALGDQNNEKRMIRQRLFCEAFIEGIKAKAITDSFISDGYDLLNSSMVSSMNEEEFIEYFNTIKDYSYNSTYSPSGVSNMDNTFVEYYVNKNELMAYVLQNCYTKK